MGLNNWWNAGNKAEEFLSTGVFNEVVIGGSDQFNEEFDQDRCTTTSDCASGYACVNGKCVQAGVGGSTGGGIFAGPGACDPFDPNDPQRPIPGAGGCNQGGATGCQGQANCGNGAQIRKCCGTRTCSFSAFGVVCVCDEDINFGTACSDFCDSYLAANGEGGAGCTEEQACGECNECSSGECVPKLNRPCWCDGGETCDTDGCYQCVSDPDDEDFGECRFEEENCQDCATITNFLCPCNIILPPITVCKPVLSGGLLAINEAQAEAVRRCAEECKVDTVCDCNCDNDCPDCEYCTQAGVCEPDPACDEELFEYVYKFPFFDEENLGGVTANNRSGPPRYGDGPFNVSDNASASYPHTVAYYKLKRRDCGGQETIDTSPTLFRFPLGSQPYFPGYDDWENIGCNQGCEGTPC